jgi:flagellar biosynthesis/type III secretory pathway protein FliH
MNYHDLANTLKGLSALCEREAGVILSVVQPKTVEDHREIERCRQVHAACKAYPHTAERLIADARKEAREEGREEGIAAMRDATNATHERYMQQLAALQTRFDAARADLQEAQRSISPNTSSIFSRRWVGCSSPQHAHAGDPHCPECLWQ